MSDTSDDDDMAKFREAVDTSFNKLIDESRGKQQKTEICTDRPVRKSERYLEEASHYSDVKVPEEMQKKIGDKVSAIINKNIKFIDVTDNGIKKHKVKGGIKLFRDSESFLTCEDVEDTSTEIHNRLNRNLERKRRAVDEEINPLNYEEKINATAVSGEYVISKEETKCWKSRRKDKIFRYKQKGKSKVLTAIE